MPLQHQIAGSIRRDVAHGVAVVAGADDAVGADDDADAANVDLNSNDACR